MSTREFTGQTDFESFEEFLDEFLTDRGQIISRRFDCELLPPPTWSEDKTKDEMALWGRQGPHKLCRNGSHIQWVLSRSLPIINAADLLDRSTKQVLRMLLDGAFGGIKLNNLWRLYRKSIQKFLKD